MKESKICGRVAVYVPGHPAANNRGYVLRYRYVMEQHLGRFLNPDELVHHKNGNKLDDTLENLELITRSAHAVHHWKNDIDSPGRKRTVDRDTVAKLRKEGLGCRRIAALLGCAKGTVQRIFDGYSPESGLSVSAENKAKGDKSKRKIDRNEVFRLEKEGLYFKQIATRLGCSNTAVWYILHNTGLRLAFDSLTEGLLARP